MTNERLEEFVNKILDSDANIKYLPNVVEKNYT